MTSVSFDRAASFYDETRGYPPGVASQIAEAIITHAGAQPQSRFLELGVGTGRIALPIITRGYPYTGIDISEQMMDRLRQKVIAWQEDHPAEPPLQVTLMQGDTLALPFDDAVFDVALTVHVLHLVADANRTLDEALRVLKPGGVYLNGVDASQAPENGVPVFRLWTEITRELGYTPPQLHASSANELAFDELHRRGMQPERIETVTWETQEPAREILNNLTNRIWSHTWGVPDDIFAESIARLQAQLTDRYGDELDRPDTIHHTFVLTKVQKPSGQ